MRLRPGAALPLALLTVAAMATAAESSRAPGSVFRDCDDCPEMVVIPPGRFVMGTPSAVGAPGAGP